MTFLTLALGTVDDNRLNCARLLRPQTYTR
jgi:hypothetical protein